MTTPFDCALDSISFSGLDDRIALLDLQEEAPHMRLNAVPSFPEGQQILCRQRESLSVRLIFAIHEPDPQPRQQLLQLVRGWAEQGGVFTASDHPGQQLTVICPQLPAIAGDDWTAPLTLVLTAARIPYWEDAAMTQHQFAAPSTFTVPGTTKSAPVNAMVVNEGTETVTHFTLRCGKTHMTFNGVTLPPNAFFLMVNIGGVLNATIGGESVLHCRTADSSDELLAPCGQSCPVEVSANQPLNTIFMARGRYA